MSKTMFSDDRMAQWYACQHYKTDPGVVAVYYLPTDSPDREIRLVEVNKLIGMRDDSALEPIDFGVDAGTDSEHRLCVLDVTPEQWDRLQRGALQLPPQWSLVDATLMDDR